MRKWIVYILIIGVVWVVPTERMDVGKLRPVQVVSLYRENGQIVIETDTRDRGAGLTPTQALADLEDTTPGVIYLDTAQYLLVAEDALDLPEAFRGELKQSVQMCLQQGKIDISETAQYLSAHGQMPRLKNWKRGVALPTLRVKNKRLFLS